MASITPPQLIALVDDINTKTDAGLLAYATLRNLVRAVKTRIDQSNPLNVPLTQAETDAIVAYYSPLYSASLTEIEIAGDALGTDPFH